MAGPPLLICQLLQSHFVKPSHHAASLQTDTCASRPLRCQVRGELTGDARRKVNTLVITDVHARDIVDMFVRDSVMDAREFAWESQLRFYWDRGLVRARVLGLCVPLHDCWPREPDRWRGMHA